MSALLSPAHPLMAVNRLCGRPVSAAFMVGTRQAVGMDGLLARVTREAGISGGRERPKLVLEFTDAGGAEVGSIGVPIDDVEAVRCTGTQVELHLGGGDRLVLEPQTNEELSAPLTRQRGSEQGEKA